VVDPSTAAQSDLGEIERANLPTAVRHLHHHPLNKDRKIRKRQSKGIRKGLRADKSIPTIPRAESVLDAAVAKMKHDLAVAVSRMRCEFKQLTTSIPSKTAANRELKLLEVVDDTRQPLTLSCQSHYGAADTRLREVRKQRAGELDAAPRSTAGREVVKDNRQIQKAGELVASAQASVQAGKVALQGNKLEAQATRKDKLRRKTKKKRLSSIAIPAAQPALAGISAAPNVTATSKEEWMGDTLLVMLDKDIEIIKTKKKK
jgi:hypothetical protein